nr:uncharacterized protein LOC109777644 [Aegilops tauschii subsp. strangulata]
MPARSGKDGASIQRANGAGEERGCRGWRQQRARPAAAIQWRGGHRASGDKMREWGGRKQTRGALTGRKALQLHGGPGLRLVLVALRGRGLVAVVALRGRGLVAVVAFRGCGLVAVVALRLFVVAVALRGLLVVAGRGLAVVVHGRGLVVVVALRGRGLVVVVAVRGRVLVVALRGRGLVVVVAGRGLAVVAGSRRALRHLLLPLEQDVEHVLRAEPGLRGTWT